MKLKLEIFNYIDKTSAACSGYCTSVVVKQFLFSPKPVIYSWMC